MYRHGKKKDDAVEELTVTEFRTRILNSLGKLNRKETVKTGTDELLALCEQLGADDDSLAIFMNNLLEFSEVQTAFYKKEVMKIAATAVLVHKTDVQSYIPKIVSLVSKYIKDKDSAVQQTCADALGVISKNIGPPVPKDTNNLEPLSVYFKPLFTLLAEQNKHIQQGTALCLTSVILNSPPELVLPSLGSLISRIQKHLNHPGCLSKSSLYLTLGALVESTKEDAIQYAPTIVAIVADGFGSSDWNDRKAAADTVYKLGENLQQAMSPLKQETLNMLELVKFDKVKPVRDSATSAIQLFQNLPDPSQLGSGAQPISSDLLKTLKKPLKPSTATESLSNSTNQASLARKRSTTALGTTSSTTPGPRRTLNSTASSPALINHEARARTATTTGVRSSANIPHTVFAPPPPKTSVSTISQPEEDLSEGFQDTENEQIESSEYENDNNISYRSNQTSEAEIDDPRLTQSQPAVMRRDRSRTEPLRMAQSALPEKSKPVSSSTKAQALTMDDLEPEEANGSSRPSARSETENSNAVNNEQYEKLLAEIQEQKQQLQLQHQQQQLFQQQIHHQQQHYNNTIEQMKNEHKLQLQRITDAYQNQTSNLQQQLNVMTEQYKQILAMIEQMGTQTKTSIDQIGERLSGLESSREASGFAATAPKTQAPEVKNTNTFEKKDPFATTATMTQRENANMTTASQNLTQMASGAVKKSDNVWNSATDQVFIGNFEAAYNTILQDGDTLQLIRLMEKTGPVLEQLEPTTATELFMRFIQLLKQQQFVDNIFPWIEQAISRAVIPLSFSQLKQLQRVLGDLSAMPTQQGIQATNLFENLRRHMAQLPPN